MNVIKIVTRFCKGTHNLFPKHIFQITVFSQRNCNTKLNIDDVAYDENIKTKILNASLPFVLTHGWSLEAIEKGAESIGYPAVVHGLFPRKAGELVEYFTADCNKKLVEILKKDAEITQDHDPIKFVHVAIETRLRMIIPYVNTWPQAMSYMALPNNVTHSLANILTLVDDICYYAGDRSVDFYWYTRRIGLATMYKATELYLVQDKSEDYVKTWQFLERRLEDLRYLQSKQQETENVFTHSNDVLFSTFATARNILGLNWKR